MHALGLFVERLGRLTHEDAARPILASLQSSVHALQDLLDALLDVSRLDAGIVRPNVEPVELAALWERLRGQFATAAEAAGLELRLRPTTLWVASDPALLHRILLNIVSNAVRYTARGGVLVACRLRGDRAWIEVWDTGVGIPAQRQAEVFEEFVQLGNPQGDREKGLGLGLTIVQRTAKLLGHALTLKSRPGRGSCFRIELPIAAPAPKDAARAALQSPGDLAGLRVLVVDDDALAREAMDSILRGWGCEVSTAAGAEEAILASSEAPPDVIACDFRLGKQNGLELIERLRTRMGRRVAAFLVSGDTDPTLLRAAAAAGLPLLHKPVRPARLRAVLQRVSSRT
jgi:CheY-like chemotaxis protein/two-component sensor histidine kinase